VDKLKTVLSSIRFRVVFSYLFIILIPFSVIGIIANTAMQKEAISKETERLLGEIRSTNDYVTEILNASRQFNSMFFLNENLIKGTTDIVNTDQIAKFSQIQDIQYLYGIMDNYVDSNPHAKSIYFYNFSTDAFYLATDRQLSSLYTQDNIIDINFNLRRVNIDESPWYQDFKKKQDNNVWILTDPIEDEGDPILAYCSRIKLARQNVFALISSNIRESAIYEILQKTAAASGSQMYMIDASGQILSTTDRDLLGVSIADTQYAKLYQEPYNPNESFSQIISIGGKDNLAVGYRSENGWLYLIVTPYAYIMDAAKQSRNVMILLYLSVALLSSLSLFSTSRFYFDPVNQLSRAMKRFEKGDFHVRLPENRKDEFGYIFAQFNETVASIDELVRKNYINEIQKKNATMKFIQTQINRHFLFNTMDLINWNVLQGDRDKASETLVALSNFYRISLTNGGDMITVSETMEMLSHYTHIIELRYPGRYRITIEGDAEIYGFKVLKFIFQPLVENAFHHGVIKPGDEVHIRFKKQGEGVLFTVEDNGRGIQPEKLKEIHMALQDEDFDSSSNFALKSINQHIKLFYGNQYGLTIESNWGKGTIVKIYLPKPGGV